MSVHSTDMEKFYATYTKKDMHDIMLNFLDCDSVSDCLEKRKKKINTEAVSLETLKAR